MKFNGSDSHSHRWAFILAGGDGKRLLPLTRRVAGDDRPKQLCAVLGEETLLHQTQRRISRLVQSWRTVLVLTKTHEPFYADEVAGIPSSRLLIQPSNQGTAPAILYSVLRLCEIDPKGVVAVAFFPSDHHFSDDKAFIGNIESAYDAAASRPEVVILLGIPPESPEVEYGWIEPGIPLGSHVPANIYRVSHFWEKPSATLAATLMERGCLWNSFVMVGHVQAFLDLMRNTLPPLVEAFESIRSSFFTAYERRYCLSFTSVFAPPAFLGTSCQRSQMTSLCFAQPASAGAIWENRAVSSPCSSAKASRQTWGFRPSYGSRWVMLRKAVDRQLEGATDRRRDRRDPNSNWKA